MSSSSSSPSSLSDAEEPRRSTRTRSTKKRSYDFLFFANDEEHRESPQDTLSVPPAPNAAALQKPRATSMDASSAITPRRSGRARPPRTSLLYGLDNNNDGAQSRVAKKRRSNSTASTTTSQTQAKPAEVTPTGRTSKNAKARTSKKPKKKKQKQPYEPGTLTGLAAAMLEIIQNNDHDEIHLDVVEKQLGLPGRRRIYDVIHVMEGAGFIKWIPKQGGHRKEGHYRWLGNDKKDEAAAEALLATNEPFQQNEEDKALEEEEKQLDAWLAFLKQAAMDPSDERLYVSSRYLQESLFEMHKKEHPLADPSSFLLVVTPEGSAMRRAHPGRKHRARPDGFNEHHYFSIEADPNNANTLPEAYVMEHPKEPPRPLSLVPPPGLYQECCSDFSYNALRHGLFWDIQDGKKDDNTVDMGLLPTLLQAGASLCWIQS